MPTTSIATGTRVTGRVEVDGDLVVEGRVEGALAVREDVTVASGGVVVADVRARRVVVRGVVIGNVAADDAIDVGPGARVVGDLRAPDVAVAADATVEGRIDRMAPAPPALSVPRRPRVRTRDPLPRPTPPTPVGLQPASPPAHPRTPDDDASATWGAPPAAPRPQPRVRLVPRRREF